MPAFVLPGSLVVSLTCTEYLCAAMAKAHLFKSYVTTAAAIIQQYDGSTPLSDFLKKYFAPHKKYGSRDRKHITHLCYCYYRSPLRPLKGVLNVPLENLDTEKKILYALFLCSTKENEILAELNSEWNKNITLSTEEKLKLTGYPSFIENIFPWQDELSAGIDAYAFALSHLTQPDLFLRIRPNQKQHVIQKLQANNIVFEEFNEGCLALPNNTKIDGLISLNKEAVVQDYSSQRTREFLEIIKSEIPCLRDAVRQGNPKSQTSVWDCCTASGGKSILAYDVLNHIDLTVSDIRSSIIHNLKQRFKEAGITKYHSFVADLTNYQSPISNSLYDLVICDVPCSGSGTWGRTPEQLYFFTTEKIDYYSNLQKQIVKNVIPHVKQGGYFLYITCSVFKKENEGVVDFILKNSNLQLIKKEVLIGYDKKADTMFGALFKNPQ